MAFRYEKSMVEVTAIFSWFWGFSPTMLCNENLVSSLDEETI